MGQGVTEARLKDLVTQGTEARRVLAIAYFFPPLDSIGCTRTDGFARYLPEWGYRMAVLTTGAYGRMPNDKHRGVYRTWDVATRIKQMTLGRRDQTLPALRSAQGQVGIRGQFVGLSQRLLCPDPEILWLPFAVLRGLRVLRTAQWELLYSTSPPETDHLIALILKRWSRLPWVADFRDGWMFEPLRPTRLSSRLRFMIESWLEARVVSAAERIVTVNDAMRSHLQARYPQDALKVTVVTNGYDPEDFASMKWKPRNSTRLQIVHAGRISGSRQQTSIHGLLTALEILQSEDSGVFQDLELHFVGELTPSETEAVCSSRARAAIKVVGTVPRSEAIQLQANADVLLMITVPGKSGVTTGKLFEYMGTGLPVLALTGNSPASELVSELGNCYIAPPDDGHAIAGALRRVWSDWKSGALSRRSPPAPARFERRNLTRALAVIFDEVLAEGSRAAEDRASRSD